MGRIQGNGPNLGPIPVFAPLNVSRAPAWGTDGPGRRIGASASVRRPLPRGPRSRDGIARGDPKPKTGA